MRTLFLPLMMMYMVQEILYLLQKKIEENKAYEHDQSRASFSLFLKKTNKGKTMETQNFER